jgi:hypothetical protein
MLMLLVYNQQQWYPFSGALLTGRAGILLSIPGLKGCRFFTTCYHCNDQCCGNEFSFHVLFCLFDDAKMHRKNSLFNRI